jgi:hypothetical protein
MNDDAPKLPTHQPQYAVERSIVNASPVPNKEKNPFNEPPQETGNFNGLIVAASGTANASGISPYVTQQEYVYIIPESAPLPEVEMQKQNLGRNMELATNPTENK